LTFYWFEIEKKIMVFFLQIRDPEDSVRQLMFSIIQTFFDESASFLQLANAHCRITR
jgi:hypothetical protein